MSTSRTHRWLRIALAVSALATGLGSADLLSSAAAQPASTPISGEIVHVAGDRLKLEIAERFAKVLQFPNRVTRVDGFDQTVINVQALASDQLRVQALAEGVTTMIVTDEHGAVTSIEVLAAGDARMLQAVLKRHYPNTSVQATKLRDSVLLRGWVTEPQQITEIVDIARLYYPNVLNQMVLGGPQQVQLRCKVMEVQRSKTRRLGLNFTDTTNSYSISSTPGPITPLGAVAAPLGGPAASTLATSGLSNSTMSLGVVSDNHAFLGLIDALRNEGLLEIQAEPIIITRNGNPAKIVSGGEFPIPVPQGLGTVGIEWREYGVRLESVPQIISPYRLKQTIIAEVSEKDLTSAVTIASTTVPALTKRTVETQVEMNFGQTLAIGGLLFTRNTGQASKIPFLGELPVIGAAFRRVSFDEAETEMLVLITPEFVGAMTSDQIPAGGVGQFNAAPTDRELFLGGNLEVPIYGQPCQDCEGRGGAVPSGVIANPNYSTNLPPGTVLPPASGMGSGPMIVPPSPTPLEAPFDRAAPGMIPPTTPSLTPVVPKGLPDSSPQSIPNPPGVTPDLTQSGGRTGSGYASLTNTGKTSAAGVSKTGKGAANQTAVGKAKPGWPENNSRTVSPANVADRNEAAGGVVPASGTRP